MQWKARRFLRLAIFPCQRHFLLFFSFGSLIFESSLPFWLLNFVDKQRVYKVPLSLRAVLSTSRRKKDFFYFLPMKKVQDTCFKNSLVVLQFSFFASPQAKNHFWPDHPANSDRKCQFQRFCPARTGCNNVAHGILSCYKL